MPSIANPNRLNPINKPVRASVNQFGTKAATALVHGEKVKVHKRSTQAILEDAAEELTFAYSEKMEKDIAKRKIRSQSKRGVEAITIANRIRAYLEQVPDLEKNKRLIAYIEDLRKRHDSFSQQEYLEWAREFSDDETHQYIALLTAHQALEEAGATSEQLAKLGSAVQALQRESGPAIRAGLNVSAVAAQHADRTGLDDTQGLRQLYRDTVLDYSQLSEAYKTLIEKYPFKDFPKIVQFVLSALTADLSAAEQSLDRTRLQAVLKDIQQFRLLGGLQENADALLAKMKKLFAENPADAKQFMEQMVHLIDRGWHSSDSIRELPINMRVQALKAQVYFMRELKQMIKDIPLQFYASDYARRDKFVSNVQEAMNMVIHEENSSG